MLGVLFGMGGLIWIKSELLLIIIYCMLIRQEGFYSEESSGRRCWWRSLMWSKGMGWGA